MKQKTWILVLAGASIAAGCSESHGGDEDAAIVFDAAFPDAGQDAGPPASNVGTECVSDTDCTGPATTCLDSLPGGYCTDFCMTDDECPAGSVCTVVDRRGTAICLDACDPASSEDQCPRTGYGCATEGAICIPGCEDDTDCESGQMCDPTGGFSGEGACFDPASSLGDSCMESGECPASGFCLSDRFGFPGGYCSVFGCDPDANTGCPDGGVCFPTRGGGICFAGCTVDSDCGRSEYECQDSIDFPGRRSCQPAFDPANLGTVCSAGRGDCTGGACLSESESGFPDSYCVAVGCDPMATTSECPGDGVCVETAGGGGLCLDGCTADTDCRAGYDCRPSDAEDSSSPTACLPGCDDSTVCGNDGFECNTGTGLCTEAFVPMRLGEPCLTAEDCPGGRCLTEEGSGWPAGTCTYPGCRLSGTGREAACPSGSACVDDAVGDPELGVCVETCAVAASGECRPGYACVELTSGGVAGTCQPACTASDCGGGRTCNTTSGLCE